MTKVNEGDNLRKLRLIMGLRQSRLALKLGEGWNQQRVSYLENKIRIDITTLNQIAVVLQVPVWLFQMPQHIFNGLILSPLKKENSCHELYMIMIVDLYERLLISERELYLLKEEFNN